MFSNKLWRSLLQSLYQLRAWLYGSRLARLPRWNLGWYYMWKSCLGKRAKPAVFACASHVNRRELWIVLPWFVSVKVEIVEFHRWFEFFQAIEQCPNHFIIPFKFCCCWHRLLFGGFSFMFSSSCSRFTNFVSHFDISRWWKETAHAPLCIFSPLAGLARFDAITWSCMESSQPV